MRVTTEPLENRQILMSVEVDQSRVDQELKQAARKQARKLNLPGFRKGKAPYHVVVQYVGLPRLYEDFAQKLAQEAFEGAIQQEEIVPYGQAQMHDIESLEPLTFKYTVPIEPEVDLSDYRNLRVEEILPEVSDEDVEVELENLREPHAGWTNLERPSEYGDMMTIDVKSVLTSTEAEVEAAEGDSGDEGDDSANVVLDEKDWEVTLDEENPLDPPGLDEELLGLAPGAEKEFDITWPDDIQSIYAGQTAHFHVNVHEVKAYQTPEFDDELAKQIDEDVETFEELRTKTRESLEETAKRTAEATYAEKVMTLLMEQSSLDYPPTVVEDQLNSMMAHMEQQIRQIGLPGLSSFLQQTGQTIEQYRDGMREQAEAQARQFLVISELIQSEEIEVSEEEIEERVNSLVETLDAEDPNTQSMVDALKSPNARLSMMSDMLQQRAVDRLLAIARGEVDFEAEEQAKQEAAATAAAETALADSAQDESGDDADSEAVEEAASTDADENAEGEGKADTTENR